jgi:hypothetical protein
VRKRKKRGTTREEQAKKQPNNTGERTIDALKLVTEAPIGRLMNDIVLSGQWQVSRPRRENGNEEKPVAFGRREAGRIFDGDVDLTRICGGCDEDRREGWRQDGDKGS